MFFDTCAFAEIAEPIPSRSVIDGKGWYWKDGFEEYEFDAKDVEAVASFGKEYVFVIVVGGWGAG